MSANLVMDKRTSYMQAIQEAYPDLLISSARLLTGEGQFNDIVLLNEELIFRFPREQESIPDLLQETEILKALQGRLSLPIPDPIYTNLGSRQIGKSFMGYKMLPGRPLFREVLHAITDEAILDSFARQLALFLHDLHGIPIPVLPADLKVRNRLLDSRRFYSDIQALLFQFMRPEARTMVTNHFESYFDNPRLHQYQPCLIHGDFGGSNLLFEADRITAVIDFSFAGLDDPAADIAALSTFGDPFFARIREYYLPGELMLERARFYRGTFALYEALHGFRSNDPEAFRSGMENYI